MTRAPRPSSSRWDLRDAALEVVDDFHEMRLAVRPVHDGGFAVTLEWQDRELGPCSLGPTVVTVDDRLKQGAEAWLREPTAPVEGNASIGEQLFRTFLAVPVRPPGAREETTFFREILARWLRGAAERYILRLRLLLEGGATRYPWETLWVPNDAVPQSWPSEVDAALKDDPDLRDQLNSRPNSLVLWPWLSLVREVDDAPDPRLLIEKVARRVVTWCAEAIVEGEAAATIKTLTGRNSAAGKGFARSFRFRPIAERYLTGAAMRELFGPDMPHVLVHLGHGADAALQRTGARTTVPMPGRLLLWHREELALDELAGLLAATPEPDMRGLVLLACSTAPAAASLARHVPLVVAMNAPVNGLDVARATLTLVNELMAPGAPVDRALQRFRAELASLSADGALFAVPAVYLAPHLHALVADPDKLAVATYARRQATRWPTLCATELLEGLPMARYYMPRLVRPKSPAGAPEGPRDETELYRPAPIETLVGRYRYIVVEGEGGSGKSELLRDLAQRLARHALRDLGSSHRWALVPVLVSLRGAHPRLSYPLPRDVTAGEWRRVRDQLHPDQHGTVLLIDGASALTSRETTRLVSFLARLRWHSLVLTCRSGGAALAENQLGRGRAIVTELLPLEPGDVDAFLFRLESHEHYGAAARRIRGLLAERPAAMVLCQRVPLLLHALVRAALGGRVPTLLTSSGVTVAALLGAALDQILRQPLREGARGGGPELGRDTELRNLLEELASAINDERAWGGLDHAKAVTVAGLCGIRRPAASLAALVRATGLVRQGPHRDISFCHDRVYEHFLAEYLRRRPEERSVWTRGNWWRRRQQPVLALLFAGLHPTGRRKLLRGLETATAGIELERRLYLWAAARCCREAGPAELEKVPGLREHLAAALAEEPDVARALRELGDALPEGVRALLLHAGHATVLPAERATVARLIAIAQGLTGGGEMDWREALRLLLEDAGWDAVPNVLARLLQLVRAGGSNPIEIVEAAARFAPHPTITEALTSVLDHPSWQVRQAAGRVVGGLAHRVEVRQRLLQLVRGEGTTRWGQAAAAMAMAKGAAEPEARLTLMAPLKSQLPEDAWLAAAATRALGPLARAHPEVATALRAAADSEHPWVRLAAAEALAPLVDRSRNQAVLVRLAEQDADGFVRAAAVTALSPVAPLAEFKRTLLRGLGDWRGVVRAAAAAALAHDAAAADITPQLVAAIDDPDQRVREAAAVALTPIVAQHEAARARLLSRLRKSPSSLAERRALMRALAEVAGATIRDQVVSELGDKEEWTRATAVEWLGGDLGNWVVRDRVIALLGDRSVLVRWTAARVLRAVRDPQVLAAFRSRLASDGEPDGEVRRVLLETLASAVEEDLDRARPSQEAGRLAARLVDAVARRTTPDPTLATILAERLGIVVGTGGQVHVLPGSPVEGRFTPR